MNEIKLNDCPFCGAEAKLHVTDKGVCVKCTECFGQSVMLIDKNDTSTAVYAVIDFWNRRVKV